MPDKYLRHISGVLTEIEATAASAGAANAGELVALDENGQLDPSVLPSGVGADVVQFTTSEAVAAGDFVNIHDDSGAKVRKADGTAIGKQAHGFVLDGASSGGTVNVYFEGVNNQVTGLTPGATQYLSTTAGDPSDTPPSGSGNISQALGVALSATAINVEIERPIVLV